jgi:Ankyrin repeats (many copies)
LDVIETVTAGGGVPLSRKSLSPAFSMALLTGALESVRLHLRAGSQVDATDEKGRSPLMLVASKGHLNVCRLLLESGADPTLRDAEGCDALTIALLNGEAATTALLLGVGKRVNAPENGLCDQETSSTDGEVAPNSVSISTDWNEAVAGHANQAAPAAHRHAPRRGVDA